MMADQQQVSGLAVIASLLAPPQASTGRARAVVGATSEVLPADGSWDAMVRWFDEQREWAELVATYAELNPEGVR